jgi:hypothetical protein
MSSKVGDSIRPPFFKGDVVGRTEHAGQDREKGRGNDREPKDDKAEADAAFFSVDAIRTLLKQQAMADGALDESFAGLDLLQQQGITSIPIRPEQDILAAIADAVAALRGK